MSAVPFDTLKFARKLEASGLTAGIAAGTAEALAEAMSGAELATKSDIAAIKADISSLRTELKADIAGLRTELKLDMELLRRDLVIKLGSTSMPGVGVLLAAIRYLPAHP